MTLHDERRNSPKPLKLKLFRFRVNGDQGSTKNIHWLLPVTFLVIMVALFYLILFGIGSLWIKYRTHSGDVFYLISFCVTLVIAVAYVVYILSACLSANKVLDGGDEEDDEEIVAWSPYDAECYYTIISFSASCMFSFLAAIIGWQTNNYLEKGTIKHPHSFLLLIGCFGVVFSIACALLSFSVLIAIFFASNLAMKGGSTSSVNLASDIETPAASGPVSDSSGGGETTVKRSKANERVLTLSLSFIQEK